MPKKIKDLFVFFVKMVANLNRMGYTIDSKGLGGENMNEKITIAKVKAKRFCKKAKNALNRHFNITFSLKRKKDPENPLLSVNVKGEIPREIVAFLAVLGGITLVWSIWKLIRKMI